MTEDQLIRVLKALGEPKRFRMVREIADAGELNCGQLGEKFPLSQPAVSHHLKILTDAGVLRVRVEAQHRYVSVAQDVLELAGLHLSSGAAAADRKAPSSRRRKPAPK
jgi:DNA-binding transcriptional ArsR family regulator